MLLLIYKILTIHKRITMSKESKSIKNNSTMIRITRYKNKYIIIIIYTYQNLLTHKQKSLCYKLF